MDGHSNRKRHFLIIGRIGLITFILTIVFLAGYNLISPRYSETMNISIALRQGENINEFSKKYKLKSAAIYDTQNGTFRYPQNRSKDILNYIEEIKRLPEVEDAQISPIGTVE